MACASIEASTPGQVAPLYRKLRPRPNGLSRAEVAADQRRRLYGATIEAVTTRGYAETSVAGLCRLAGVSKRTFYQQFSNKESCFLATYDSVLGCAQAHIEAAAHPQDDWEATIHAVVGSFVQVAFDQPKLTRMALLQVSCAGPRAVVRRDQARRWFDDIIASTFDEASYGVALPTAVAKGIACGIERVVCRRVLAGDIEGGPALAHELADWALSYASPMLAALPAIASPCDARPATPWLRARAQAGNERARILRASAEIIASDGYARLTVGAITRRAEVSEESFGALYADVEECFLGVLDIVGLETLMVATRASRGVGDGPVGVCRAIAALMECVAGDSVLRAIAFLEVFAVGRPAVERSESLLGGFAELLVRGISQRPPDVMLEATVGALWGVAHHHVVRGTASLLPGLAGHMAYLALAPFVGAEAAAETILAAEDRGAATSTPTAPEPPKPSPIVSNGR